MKVLVWGPVGPFKIMLGPWVSDIHQGLSYAGSIPRAKDEASHPESLRRGQIVKQINVWLGRKKQEGMHCRLTASSASQICVLMTRVSL